MASNFGRKTISIAINKNQRTPYLTIEDTAVYNIGEPVQMDLNSEYEKLLMEKGFQTGTLPGTVEFSIDKVNIFDSPNEAGIIDLHGTCQDELKPSTDSKFLLLECTLKNVSAYTILENGNKQKYTSFSANHFEIATKEGDVFLSESGNSSGAARISRTRALGGDYYFDKCNPENIGTSNYYVISLDHGESITYQSVTPQPSTKSRKFSAVLIYCAILSFERPYPERLAR